LSNNRLDRLFAASEAAPKESKMPKL